MIAKEDIVIVNPKTMELVEQVDLTDLEGCTFTSAAISKNKDGTLDGIRYVVTTEPSNLRPIKSWTINIETWHCTAMADIISKDVLFVRLLNVPTDNYHEHKSYIKDIIVENKKLTKDNQTSFNAIMAAGVIINKIDAGRSPDIQKTLKIYNLD